MAVGISVPLLMRLPLSWLARALEPLGPLGPSAPLDDANSTVESTLSMVDGALRRGRPLVRTGCLTRSVTRYWFLRRAGLDVSLVFGVAQIDGRIESHCWVERNGVRLREPEQAAQFRQVCLIRRPGLVTAVADV